MVQLVTRRQKKFSRNKTSFVPKIIRYSAPASFIRRLSSFFLIWFIVVVFVLIMKYIFQQTIFSSDYTIESVRYDSWSVWLFDEPLLYSAITKALRGKNYYMVKYFGQWDILDAVSVMFPIVSDMKVFFLERNTAAVSVRFLDPLMLISAWEKKFAVYDEHTIVPLYPQNTLGNDVVQLQLADYTSWFDTLDGLFFKLSPEMLFNQLMVFDAYFKKPYTVIYFPWAEKTQIVAADGKILYINNMWNIDAQLAKIDILKSYYPDFEALRMFDLGSLDIDTLIVRK